MRVDAETGEQKAGKLVSKLSREQYDPRVSEKISKRGLSVVLNASSVRGHPLYLNKGKSSGKFECREIK